MSFLSITYFHDLRVAFYHFPVAQPRSPPNKNGQDRRITPGVALAKQPEVWAKHLPAPLQSERRRESSNNPASKGKTFVGNGPFFKAL